MTENELKTEAAKRYPVGSKIVSLFGATDVVIEPDFLVDKYNVVLAKCRRENRVVHDNGIWAEILNESPIKG